MTELNKVTCGACLIWALGFATIAAPAFANTTTLECSFDGYPDRAPFTIDVNKDRRTVTIHHIGENIGPVHVAPYDVGPLPAVIGEKTISFHTPVTPRTPEDDTVIDRVSGRAMENICSPSCNSPAHVPWSCHAAKNQF